MRRKREKDRRGGENYERKEKEEENWKKPFALISLNRPKSIHHNSSLFSPIFFMSCCIDRYKLFFAQDQGSLWAWLDGRANDVCKLSEKCFFDNFKAFVCTGTSEIWSVLMVISSLP